VKYLILLILPLYISCAPIVNPDAVDAPAYNGEFGKPGPGAGESCYVGSLKENFRCAEASEADAVKLLRQACKQFGGQHFNATCTQNLFQGTCRKLRPAPGVLVRYYGVWNLIDAQIDCGETFNGLFDTQY
jgi:hypothetical protein